MKLLEELIFHTIRINYQRKAKYYFCPNRWRVRSLEYHDFRGCVSARITRVTVDARANCATRADTAID